MHTVADRLLDALAAHRVTHLFGNPGSTELPLIDALSRHGGVRYVQGLHEAAVVGMADGWAQATGRMAAVNLHVTSGVATGLAALMNARRARVPMLVIVGTQHTALRHADPFLGGDAVAMARPVVAHAEEVDSAAEVPDALARCVARARAAPAGPVVLAVPSDVQAQPSAPLGPASAPHHAPAALDADAVRRAAGLLAGARSPCIVAGDGVAHHDAGPAVAGLAERLGAPLYGEPHGARAPVPWDHPLWGGHLPPLGADIRAALDGHDVVLALGCPVFRVFGPSPGPLMGPGTRLVHVDVDADGLGRVVEPAVAIHADPAAFLAAVDALVPEPRDAPARRRHTEAAIDARRAAAARDPQPAAAGITPHRLAVAVAGSHRPGDLLVDESLTSGRALRRLPFARPGEFLGHRGSALGWGLPAAVGAAIASPGRYCLALQGDGGLVFGAPALWTAAAAGARVGLVVADNGGYRILRDQLRAATGTPGPWPGLTTAGLDVAGLCASFGADVATVEDHAHLAGCLEGLRERAVSGPAALVVRMADGP